MQNQRGGDNGANNAANNPFADAANNGGPLVFNAWGRPYRPELNGPRANNGARNGGFQIADGVVGNGGAAANGAANRQINNNLVAPQHLVGNRVLRNGEYVFNAQRIRNEDYGAGNGGQIGAANAGVDNNVLAPAAHREGLVYMGPGAHRNGAGGARPFRGHVPRRYVQLNS